MSSRDEAETGGDTSGGSVLDAAALDTLLDDARVPLDEIYRALDRLDERVRALGDSPRAVHQIRHRLARQLGHTATAQQEFDLWIAAPRDLSSGCFACEQGQLGDWYAERGEDTRALAAWEAVTVGSAFCDAQPHGVLARSLLPLIRLGRTRQAAANHVEGYRITRLKPSMCAEVGAHIEFCALTGNAARGLELLAEHGHWLADRRMPGQFDPGEDAARWRLTGRYADFLGGAAVLLRLLGDSGFDELPFAIAGAAPIPLGRLREQTDAALSAITARFDERNGTTAFSGRTLRRRSRQPFLSSVPLEARSALPPAAPRGGEHAAAHGPRPRPRPVGDLVEEARNLTRLWHPRALEAWQRARAAAEASGRPLEPDAQVEFDEQMVLADGGAALSGGVAAAVRRARLLEIADRYRAQGRLGRGLHAAGRAAFALLRSGQVDAAASDQAALRLAAADALTGHEITPDEYAAVRIGSGYQQFHLWQRLATGQKAEHGDAGEETGGEPSPWFGGRPHSRPDAGGQDRDRALPPADPDGSHDALSAAAGDALAELGEVIEECLRYDAVLYGAAAAGMAAQVRLVGGEIGQAERDLRVSVELYHEGGAPWCAAAAELSLGRLALTRGDLPAAERFARAAVEHGLDPELRGPAALLLADALWLQDGREGEAVAPALAAAAAFAEQEQEQGGGDAARARLRAAGALAAVGREQEAIALFEPALKIAEKHWDEEDWKPVIIQAARSYGSSLIATGDPRRAAELLLDAADRVKDWPNQAPHAMLAGDAATALERSGRHADAAAAFQRAAELWQRVGERMMRVRSLRSAAWALAADDLEAALGVIDGAAGELIAVLAAEDAEGPQRIPARYELAETHLQRARIVLNLAENRLLAADESQRLLGHAHQHATAAISGLWRLVRARDDTRQGDIQSIDVQRVDAVSGDVELTDVERGDTVRGDTVRGDTVRGGLLLDRLAAARITAARIEGGHLDRALIAAARLRDWAGEFEAWDRPDLAGRLAERAEKLLGAAPVVSVAPAAPPSTAQHGAVRYQTVA